MNIGELHEINWEQVGKNYEMMRGARRVTYEATMHSADGRAIPIEVHARRVEFETTESILWTLRDMTERRELDTLREDLTSMIYHDLRAPLGNVVSSLNLLEGMIGKDENARSMLEIAVRSGDRMNRLVDSLLDINRLDSGQPLALQTTASPDELVRRAVDDVILAASARRQVIRTTIREKLPTIRTDGDMIRRVLINLLENAIKFSKEGGEIEIGVRPDGDHVQFWVQDEGPGIPPSEHEHIFEKFARLGGGSLGRPGLGMGLAFCRMAVRAHGGTIRVESEAGKGSRFIVRLPLNAGGLKVK
jgi:signal transduction histidine kinase